MVNVVAIFEMGATVSHHTGNCSHMGRFLGKDGMFYLRLIVSYLAGSTLAGFMESFDNDSEAIFHGRRSPTLLTAAGVIFIGTMSHYFNPECMNWSAAMFACSQGLQNGVTSRFSSLPLRTTHMTGALTDIGLHLGTVIRARRAGTKSPPHYKAALLSMFVACFALGGFLVSCTRDQVELVWGAHVVHQEKKHVLVALLPAAMLAVIASGLPIFRRKVEVNPLLSPRSKMTNHNLFTL